MSTKIIKNIAIIGHSGEGKTTLCEAMLFNGGAIDRMGKVADGTTVSDYDDLEKAKGMFDVAAKKTEEVAALGKQKYDIVSLKSKLSKKED